jgi:hypothetical protein
MVEIQSDTFPENSKNQVKEPSAFKVAAVQMAEFWLS